MRLLEQLPAYRSTSAAAHLEGAASGRVSRAVQGISEALIVEKATRGQTH